jgi:hypothetical protein
MEITMNLYELRMERETGFAPTQEDAHRVLGAFHR